MGFFIVQNYYPTLPSPTIPLKVLELAHKLPIDKFEEFYDQEIETYGNVLQGILLQLDYEMKGIE